MFKFTTDIQCFPTDFIPQQTLHENMIFRIRIFSPRQQIGFEFDLSLYCAGGNAANTCRKSDKLWLPLLC